MFLSCPSFNVTMYLVSSSYLGDLSFKPPRYVSFPVVKPFLILRDPPYVFLGRIKYLF